MEFLTKDHSTGTKLRDDSLDHSHISHDVHFFEAPVQEHVIDDLEPPCEEEGSAHHERVDEKDTAQYRRDRCSYGAGDVRDPGCRSTLVRGHRGHDV